MNVTPKFIRDHLDQFSQKEASKILREWIEGSDDQNLREEALKLLFLVDDGKNFDFCEQIFISEENSKLRFLAGDLLAQNYLQNKKLLTLLQFTLETVKNIDQKFFAVEVLNSMQSSKALKVMKKYVDTFSEIRESNNEAGLIELFNNSIRNKRVSINIIDLLFNLVLYEFYTIICRYHISIREGFIVLLNCEAQNLGKIENIQGLSKLGHLEHLILKRNKIREISGLDNLKNLKILDLSSNRISKIDNLEHLTSLRELNLANNEIIKIRNLANLRCLEKLFLNSNNIKQIEGLEELKKLKLINLNNNKIAKLENLENLTDLTILLIASNDLKKIEGLEQNIKIRTLYLNDNSICVIEGLGNLRCTKVLNLSNNYIEKIENLENLSNLIKFEISNNKIDKIEGLESQRSLQELFLDRNYIKDLDGIKNLSSLIILYLENNEIENFSTQQIENLQNLNFIFLNGNPLTKSSLLAYHSKCKFP